MSYGEELDLTGQPEDPIEDAAQTPPAPNGDGLPAGLRIRKPTGAITYPLTLVEGEEKAGKTYALAALSNSPRVGRTFLAELGEGTLDEYAPLGPFDMLEHNGTYTDLYDQLALACSVPSDPERPNVVGLDTGTALWRLLCDRADKRAHNNKKNRKAVENDPDAEVVISMNLWNDANARWRRIVDLLMRYPGIAVITARGKEVAVVRNGEPTGEVTWAVEAQKSLTWDADAWVRLQRGKPPRLIAARSLHVDVPATGVELPRDGVLDHVLFDLLAAGGRFQPTHAALPQVGIATVTAKNRLIEYLSHQDLDDDEKLRRAATAWREAGLDGLREVTEAQYQAALEAAMPAGSSAFASPESREGDGPGPATAGEGTAERGSVAAAPSPPDVEGEPGTDETLVCAGCGEGPTEDLPLFAEDDGTLYHGNCAPEATTPTSDAHDPDAQPFDPPSEPVETCKGCGKPFTGGRGKRRVVNDDDGEPYHETCLTY